MKELNTFRQFLNEGTWGYGSKNQMLKALDKLNKIKQMGGVKGSVELSKIDDMLYNVFGNDDFHDSIDQAKDAAIDDDQFANYIGDAMARGREMIKDIHGMEGDLEENSRMEFEITPEYLFDAAMQYIQDDYDGASLHVAPDGTTDDFYDGDKHVHTIKSKEQAEDIIRNFEAQAVKTAQNDWADEQDAMYGKASFVEEELSENDKALDEIIDEEKEEIKEGLFDEIDMMMDKLAVHMSAEETLRDLMGEFEAISGGPKVLHMALKNLMMGAGLMEEEKGEE